MNGIKLFKIKFADRKSLYRIIINSIFLSLFLLNFFREQSVLLCIVVFSSLIIIILKDLLISIFSILISLVIVSLFAHYKLFGQFFIGQTTNKLLYLLIIIIILVSLIFKISFQREKSESNSQQFVIAAICLIPIKFIYDSIVAMPTASALRFLVYSGEDNQSWLNGLSSGFNPKSSNTFLMPTGIDIKSSMHTWLILFRDLNSDFGNSKIITDNIFILQRFYFFIIGFTLILVALSISEILKRSPINKITVYLFSTLAVVATYLSLASFAMFGHLPPILSLLYLDAAIFFALLFKPKNLYSLNGSIYLLTIFGFLFGAKNSWYPIAPAIYIFLILLFIFLVRKSLNLRIFIEQKYLVGLSVSIVFFLGLFQFKSVKEFFNAKYMDLAKLVHWDGGTLGPDLLQILVLLAIFYLYLDNLNKEFKYLNNRIFKYLVFSFITYFGFIVTFSLLTSPFTIDYAGRKLGLFVIAFLLPINIALFAIYFLHNNRDYLKIFVTFFSALFFIIFAGPPTGVTNPTWNTAAYPFSLINRIESEKTFMWEGVLIAKLNNPTVSDKKTLCFDKYAVRSMSAQSCSMFAAGIQGISDDQFIQYWQQVNLNASSRTEFLERMPADFYTRYSFLYLDEMQIDPTDLTENFVTNLIPRTK